MNGLETNLSNSGTNGRTTAGRWPLVKNWQNIPDRNSSALGCQPSDSKRLGQESGRKGHAGLRKRKAIGGVSKLTKEQNQRLKRFLDRGAMACGFATDRWTLQRVAELIEREFGVTYHANYLNRLLDKLGFSPQNLCRGPWNRNENW